MTQEEIEKQAEEMFNKHILEESCYVSNPDEKIYSDGFSDGAKWGISNAIEWHDLEENPNDLPKEGGEYWCKWEDGTYCTAHYFEVGGFCDCTIAWCELPKFKE